MIHPVAEAQLGMDDGIALARHDEMPLKTESLAQPLDSGWRIAIPQARYHRCLGILRETGHDNPF